MGFYYIEILSRESFKPPAFPQLSLSRCSWNIFNYNISFLIKLFHRRVSLFFFLALQTRRFLLNYNCSRRILIIFPALCLPPVYVRTKGKNFIVSHNTIRETDGSCKKIERWCWSCCQSFPRIEGYIFSRSDSAPRWISQVRAARATRAEIRILEYWIA